MLTSKRNPRGPRTLSMLFFSALLTMLRVTQPAGALLTHWCRQRATSEEQQTPDPQINQISTAILITQRFLLTQRLISYIMLTIKWDKRPPEARLLPPSPSVPASLSWGFLPFFGGFLCSQLGEFVVDRLLDGVLVRPHQAAAVDEQSGRAVDV